MRKPWLSAFLGWMPIIEAHEDIRMVNAVTIAMSADAEQKRSAATSLEMLARLTNMGPEKTIITQPAAGRVVESDTPNLWRQYALQIGVEA